MAKIAPTELPPVATKPRKALAATA